MGWGYSVIAGGTSRVCVCVCVVSGVRKWYGESLHGGDMNATLLGIHCEVRLKSTGEELGKEGQDTCVHPFFLSVPLLKTCVHQPWSFGEVLFCAENVILTLECINSVKLTQCGLKLFFYNIVEFLDMLVGHRFRNAALYHCKESVNYPELWFVTMSVFCCFWKDKILFLYTDSMY